MERLVDDLLQLTKLESGLLKLQCHPTALRPFVQTLIDRIQRSRTDRPIPALINCVPRNLPMVQIDSGQLERALRNLVDNALQYTPSGGTVTVGAVSIGRGWVEIQVTDTGSGIAGQDVERVFERFYRSDRSRERQHGHSGLGLAIVREIIEAHGGRVRVESEEQKGATFRFTVPQARQPEIGPEIAAVHGASPSGDSGMSFDRVAEIYDQTRGLPAGVPEQIASRIVAVTASTPETPFLELGVGTDRIALPFVQRGYSYTGVDISEQMMDQFRAKLPPDVTTLTLLNGDVTDLPLADQSFDVAITVHLLHLVPEWKQVLREIRRVLKPNGWYVLGNDGAISTVPVRQFAGSGPTLPTKPARPATGPWQHGGHRSRTDGHGLPHRGVSGRSMAARVSPH
jgi:predicted TPR repeat methyltransferase